MTPQRLLNPDKEPQNWLMNHRSYDGQRFSPLARINKANVKGLKFAYAVPLAGTHGGEFIEATPLAEDGFLYITDSWSVLYKIDASAGNVGRIVWRMDPKQERTVANRGAALWGNFVISPASAPARIIATDKSSGKVVWESNVSDSDRVTITGAPLAIKDKIVIGASGGDGGARDWVAALDAATGKLLWRKYTIPAPGEPGSETWKDKNNAWQTGGGAVWVTGTYDPDTNQTLWGVGNPVPMMDARARPGDNLFTNSVISWDPDNGKMNWYFQYTPGDMWDYDEVGTHILFERTVDGQPRKLVTHSARNGFVYTMERANGVMVGAKPYVDSVNWTAGIDQKTGKPVDYDPNKDVQTYSGLADPTSANPIKKVCPNRTGGNNYFPSAYSPQTQTALHSRHHGLRIGDQRQDHRRQAERRLVRADRRRLQDRRPLRKHPDSGRSGDPRNQEERAPAATRTTQARSRPPAGWYSSRSWTAPSRPSTTPRSTSCGRSMSAPASPRRR